MGGKHTGHKYGGRKSKFKNEKTRKSSGHHWYDKGIKTEDKALVPVLLEVCHINFYTGKEHYVEKANCPEKQDTAVTVHQVEAIWTNHGTCYYQPDYLGNPDFVQ
ncbi:hypothetical protein SDC9_76455 [bioreactor metagenome]|uniref:Uncharacterized protein n=1 Tax=bioreactor metagenome TaxID=1076179 RepID=A0A644YTW6_9ZZZZ